MDRLLNDMHAIDRLKVEHRGLALIRFLARQPRAASNERIVGAVFDHLGLSCSQQELRACLQEAEASGLVCTRSVDNLLVVTLSAKGEEAAQGKIAVDGVLKPGANCPY
jgi:hypothetical protein